MCTIEESVDGQSSKFSTVEAQLANFVSCFGPNPKFVTGDTEYLLLFALMIAAFPEKYKFLGFALPVGHLHFHNAKMCMADILIMLVILIPLLWVAGIQQARFGPIWKKAYAKMQKAVDSKLKLLNGEETANQQQAARDVEAKKERELKAAKIVKFRDKIGAGLTELRDRIKAIRQRDQGGGQGIQLDHDDDLEEDLVNEVLDAVDAAGAGRNIAETDDLGNIDNVGDENVSSPDISFPPLCPSFH